MARGILVLVLALAGCTVIHDEEFEQDVGCDLELSLREFTPHVTDVVTLQLNRTVDDGATRRLEAVAIFDPLGSENLDVHIPDAVRPRTSVTEGLAALDFYADFDDTPGFSDGDHTWVLEDICTSGAEVFLHNFDFQPVRDVDRPNTDVLMRPCGEVLAEGAVEVRVTRLLADDTTQSVGFYRLANIATRPAGIRIPDVANADVDTRIEVLRDANRNGIFDSGDVAWSYTHRRESLVRCEELFRLEAFADGCPPATAITRPPVPACVTPEGDLAVIVSPFLRANLTDALFAPSWVTPNP